MTSPPIRIMLVDDSIVVRGLLRRIIEKESDLEIVSTAVDGESGVQDYKQLRPDIVVMDIEMPKKDGLTALREILAFDRSARVIMCSSLTQSGAEATLKALSIGALDCLAKPSSQTVDRGISFEQEIVSKLRVLGRAVVPVKTDMGQASTPDSVPRIAPAVKATPKRSDIRPLPLPLPKSFPLAIAIGSSTGGPSALEQVLKSLDKNLNVPVFITQHIPPGFTHFLAEGLQNKTGHIVKEAKEGMAVEAGCIYIAPGQKHMGLYKGIPRRISLIDSEPVNFCKPSINVMLDSLFDVYGGQLATVMLTGMGADGHDACKRMILSDKSKNVLIAQDEQTSVVWGIPGAVAKDGLCHAILPLSEIGTALNKLLRQLPV